MKPSPLDGTQTQPHLRLGLEPTIPALKGDLNPLSFFFLTSL